MATDILKAFEPLFYPKSLAVIGASSDMTKFGNIILSAFMEIGYKGKVYPVNPEAEEISGLKGYPSLKEIPGEVDFAVLTIPAPLVSSALEECLRKGVKGVEILTSGFRETGTPEGRRMEEEITRIAKRGIRILGPNCDLMGWDINVLGVVITRFNGQSGARLFKNKLERRNIKVYTHQYTKGYPTNIDLIVSEEGYGANDYIETEKPLVIVTGPGPGSGKLATCLSQVYHDHKKGIKSGYAKFETFPIWNLSLNHPVNIAYEAATAHIKDFNLIDPFHLEANNTKAVNYNRDVEVFPILRRILKKISGDRPFYRSPTDMGVNRAGFAITDDEQTREASKQELVRRYFRYQCEYAMGLANKDTVQRVELFLKDFDFKQQHRRLVEPAGRAALEAQQKNKGSEGVYCGAAMCNTTSDPLAPAGSGAKPCLPPCGNPLR